MIQAAVTMNQLQQQLDVIGHNLANSETTGYKNKETAFSSLLFQQINNMTDLRNANGRQTPDGIRVGTGARLGSINNNFSLGSMKETGRALDVALTDENLLFQIQVDGETHFTRNGAFYLQPINDNTSLQLTTADGHPVLGLNGAIILDADITGVDIRSNGDIYVQRGIESEYVGSLAIVQVNRPDLLEATGEGLFHLRDIAALGFNVGDVIQPFNENEDILKSQTLEQSNVDISKQMTDLMMAQRSYQFNSRTISMGDQMQGLINQLR